MAKKTLGVSFKNATIDINDMTITEYIKDDVQVSSIMALLKEYNGIDGLSISIKRDGETIFSEDNEE